MKTLKDLIIDSKCRRGPADATTKRGAYWLCPPNADATLTGTRTKIRRAGGDGIGQSSPDVTYYLELRHYRSGEVRAMVERASWHQNGSYSGGGSDWIDAGAILGAETIEDAVAALLGADGDCGPVYSDMFFDEVSALLGGLGLPDCLPAPDTFSAADAIAKTEQINKAKQIAKRCGLTVYAQALDGTLWISGLEKWMTADQVCAELAHRADDMSMATQRSITDGTPL